jgi:uncharacterized protein
MSTLILSPLAVASIRLYQRHLSPLKGFRCANGAESGVKSCSAFGRYVFERYDVATAASLLQRRFAACRSAFERFKTKSAAHKRKRRGSGPSRCDDGGAIIDGTCQCASGAGDVSLCDVGTCV